LRRDFDGTLVQELIMGITMSVKHFVFILGLLETGSRLVLEVSGHGMMLDPPNRSSVWRDEKLKELFNATENWADNELYCGGKGVRNSDNPIMDNMH
jgi:hypothetical protein